MTVSRPGVCLALDPLPGLDPDSHYLHERCSLPAGHHLPHESRKHDGSTLHRWWWPTDDRTPEVLQQLVAARTGDERPGDQRETGARPVQQTLWA